MNNIWSSWGEVFNTSLQGLWWGLASFAPKFVVAILFFIIGWFLGNLIAKAIEQVFNSLKIDNVFKSIGAEDFFRKAGVRLDTGYFIGQVVKWFVVIVFLLPSLNLVGLDYIASFLQFSVLGFLPRVIVAAFILIIAAFVSQAISKAVTASVKTMNLHSANMLGALSKYTVWVFALIIALGQLGVAEYYMSVLFTGVIAMLSIAGALAFGLGGKDHASRFLSKIENEMSQRD
ncbi:MAG: hypothetical protein AAB510_01470 [Patescibacteria group bacterium]